MSSRCAQSLGLLPNISVDFEDPNLISISGHSTPVQGILRDVFFRMKGTSVTLKLDFFVSDAINDFVDIFFSADFVKDNFRLLFERIKRWGKSKFAPWYATKKETPEAKAERKRREEEPRIKANELEIKRLKAENEKMRATHRQIQQAHDN